MKDFARHSSNTFAAALAMVLCGCSTIFDSRSQKKPMMLLYASGKFDEAATLTKAKSESRKNTGDAFMWQLEEGSACFAEGKYKESLSAFREAEKTANDFEKRAVVSARDGAAEGGAVITNQNAFPYKGNYCEKILLNAYKALDYFALGDSEGARVELRRMYERQKEARDEFEDDIENAEKEANKNKYNSANIINGVPEMKQINQIVDKQSNRALGDFVNPFATYLSAIGYLSGNDYGGATVDFRNLYKMAKTNKLIQRDFATCAKMSAMDVPPELSSVKPYDYSLTNDVIFVIFANGLAAAKKAITIHLVLPPPVTGYFGVAFPVLEYFPKPYKGLTVTDSCGNSVRTEVVAEMDPIISREYKKALPGMIIRIFISVAAKETANYFALKEAKKQGDGAYWVTVAAMSAYKYAFNTADTRCWQMLPKEYQIAHLKKPKNGKLKIEAIASNGSVQTKEIKVDNNKKMTILYVNSPGQGVLSVRAFEFN